MFEVFKKEHILIAHRGNNLYPENSMLAFKKSLNKFDMIEFDVQYTKDFKAVVFHDRYLNRCSDVIRVLDKNYKINDLYLKDIKKLRLLNTNEQIPTLDEVLRFIKKNGIYANLEIKEKFDINIAEDIKNKIELLKLKDLILISSFEHKYIKFFENFYTALLFDKRINNLLSYIKSFKADAYHIDVKNVNKKDIDLLLMHNIFTNVYTVNDKFLQKKLFAQKVKGIFTDFI